MFSRLHNVCPHDLMEREKLTNVVGELANQLLWAFDVDETCNEWKTGKRNFGTK